MEYITLLKDHLSKHACRYFDDLPGAPVHVTLRRSSERINSTLYEFTISSGSAQRSVLAKIPFAIRSTPINTTALDFADRPRLCPKPSNKHKSLHEFSTLAAIQEFVRQSNDPRFESVRVLELLSQHSVLLMEKAPARSLSRDLLNASRLTIHKNQQYVAQACFRAGAWLRMFHDSDDLSHTQTRSQSRDDFLRSIQRFIEYIADHVGRADYRRVGQKIIARARGSLPRYLPLGLSHGDYAPRNVLVDSAGRVRIIDTLGRWRAPIYEDLSRFLCALHASVPQVWLQGWAYSRKVLVKLERQFLLGYFGNEPIPYEQIRLFECQALLDRWASFVYSSARGGRGMRGLAKKLRQLWWQRYFAVHLSQTMQQLSTPAEHHVSHMESVA